MNLLILFIVLNVFNVIIQTIKSIATVKAGKTVAAVVNALAYGFYTIVIIYMSSDLALWQKVLIVGLTNLIGVYLVKLFEEKARKDKLWKVEATLSQVEFNKFQKMEIEVPYNFIMANEYIVINFYCQTQEQSLIVKDILTYFKAKYFVTEAKTKIL